MEGWMDEFMELEHSLTIYEFIMLFQVATGHQSLGPLEPIWSLLGEELDAEAIIHLPESALREMAMNQRLVRIGLLEIKYTEKDGTHFTLTDKGNEAVHYWMGALEEMGLSHPTLSGL